MIKVACVFDVVSVCNKVELISDALWPFACVQIVNMHVFTMCTCRQGHSVHTNYKYTFQGYFMSTI